MLPRSRLTTQHQSVILCAEVFWQFLVSNSAIDEKSFHSQVKIRTSCCLFSHSDPSMLLFDIKMAYSVCCLGAAKKSSMKALLYELCAAYNWKSPLFDCHKEEGPSHLKRWVLLESWNQIHSRSGNVLATFSRLGLLVLPKRKNIQSFIWDKDTLQVLVAVSYTCLSSLRGRSSKATLMNILFWKGII